ncbi:signal peptidase II [Candidatus Woesearchaeota archaeon]|nr:signal peptidase II [Candidatus Woesearchaeota archaeon]
MAAKKKASRKKVKRKVVRKKKDPHAHLAWHKKPIYPYWPFGLLIFALILAIDQFTKKIIHSAIIPGSSVKITSWLWYSHVQNTGTIWGMLPGSNALMIAFSMFAFVALLYWEPEFKTIVEKVCFTLFMIGLWGNLLDRALIGYVVDFIDLGWWPVFNIADSAIAVGIIVYLLEQWRQSEWALRKI